MTPTQEERARDHILAAAKLWPRATAPPLLLARAAEAAEAHRRVPAAARAVHSQPWCRGLWESLKAAAARGRSEDPPEVPSQGSKGGGSTLRSEVRLTAGKSADAAWDD